MEEIGDGNLNDVIRLYTTAEGGDIDDSVIIKRSLPYIKVNIQNLASDRQ